MLGCSPPLAFYEAGEFNGRRKLQPSLWYRMGKNMRSSQHAPDEALVFQLGQKEEKTRNRKMAAVGEMTRWQHEQVKDDGCVRYSELVWQNGGHFTDVEKRIAHGFAWLIDHAQG